MTLILGAVGPDGTYLGADARSTGNIVYSDNAFKLIRIHNYVLGVGGSSRVSQLIEYQADVFSPIEKLADVFLFGAGLKQLLADDYNVTTGYERKDDTGSFSLLFATELGIVAMYRNFQFEVHESWAIGSGDDYGLGYFRALSLDDTELRIKTAIEETSKYVHSVGGETTVWKL